MFVTCLIIGQNPARFTRVMQTVIMLVNRSPPVFQINLKNTI